MKALLTFMTALRALIEYKLFSVMLSYQQITSSTTLIRWTLSDALNGDDCRIG